MAGVPPTTERSEEEAMVLLLERYGCGPILTDTFLHQRALNKFFGIEIKLGQHNFYEELMQPVLECVRDLIRFGGTHDLMRSKTFAVFLSSEEGTSAKLAIFKLLCHNFYQTWPRPRKSCLLCNFPLLFFMTGHSTQEIRSQFFKAFEPYMEQSTIEVARRCLKEMQSVNLGNPPSGDYQKFEESCCKGHSISFLRYQWDGEILDDLLTLLERYRKPPTLQRAAAMSVLKSMGGKRSRAAALDIPDHLVELLHPPAPFADQAAYVVPDSCKTSCRNEGNRRNRNLETNYRVFPRVYQLLQKAAFGSICGLTLCFAIGVLVVWHLKPE